MSERSKVDAYNAGVQAGHAGQYRNPYTAGTVEAAAWDMGHRDGESASTINDLNDD